MIIGVADGETYVASDVPAILKYTRNVYYIGNLEFARLVPGEAHFYDLNGDEIEKQTTEIKWDAEAAEKGGFEHFMMKEIHEQPKAVQDTLNSVIKDGAIDLSSMEITEDEIKNFEQIYIVACGSAWHVGMAAQYVLEDMADIPVRVELASEFRYRKMPLNQKALVIVVSQSGETADTLAALRLAKEKGITTMAIVNVVGSSIAREADKVLYTLAGPEISVATTKAYSAQLAAMYCLAVQFAKVNIKSFDRVARKYGIDYIRSLCLSTYLPEEVMKLNDIDEYDVPVAKANNNGYYNEMLDVMKGLMQALKDNQALQFAVVTGCLKIAKESIFTGTNNFVSDTITNSRLNEYFGFVQSEVDQLLKDANLTEQADNIKKWYDGWLLTLCKRKWI